MANGDPISLEIIVNVVFGLVACLMSAGGIYATIRAGHTQRYEVLDLELGTMPRYSPSHSFISPEKLLTEELSLLIRPIIYAGGLTLQHQQTTRLLLQETLQSLETFELDYRSHQAPHLTIVDDRGYNFAPRQR
ncbi:hypothetical protein F5Y12DRAFT_716200 [Xylaria sp. FL1777]|nr:hypothetical protein F5Y12DRAFT_716200 [Xylaria sp. FL1777]